MTPAKMQEMAKETVDAVKSYVARALRPLQDRVSLLSLQRESADQLLADLDERVAKLERERLRATE
jgi:hypothetical protein